MITKKYKGHKVNLATITTVKKTKNETIIMVITANKTHYFSLPLALSMSIDKDKEEEGKESDSENNPHFEIY